MIALKLTTAALLIPLLPAAGSAQASVQSDSPVTTPSAGSIGMGSSSSSSLGSERSSGIPNPQTGPGSPAATGTGAAGTGPSNTMAAPGR